MAVNFKAEIEKDMSESGFNVHDDLKNLTVPELRKICDSQRNPFAVCALSVTGDMNIGSIIRTSCLFGAEKVIVLGRKKFDRRGLVGSMNYIDVEFPGGLCNESLTIDKRCFINAMEGYIPIFVEQGGFELGQFNWRDKFYYFGNQKPCLVFGNENRGIPKNILDLFVSRSFRVSIPQKGVIRSHNVSVASGIVISNLCLEMGWM